MKLKIKFIAIVCALFLFAGCKTGKKKTTQNSLKIIGTITGINSGEVHYNEKSYPIQNGHFEIIDTLQTPRRIQLAFNNKDYYLSFFAENSTIKVKANTANAKRKRLIPTVEGSKTNAEYEKVNTYLSNLESSKRLHKYYLQLQGLKKGTAKYKEVEKLESEAREDARKAKSKYITQYALTHSNSVVAAYYMRFQANEVDQPFAVYKKIVEGFSPTVKKSPSYKPLKETLERLENVAIGKVAPNFTLKTNTGKDFTLSSLRGKYVLVDFWASWCAPCRASFPALKKIYKKYKDYGFEIVGVTNDSNHKQWKKAIADDQLPWIQVADVFPPRDQGPPFTARVITKYAAPYLPSSYLLNKKGEIIAKHLEPKELAEKLAQIFKTN